HFKGVVRLVSRRQPKTAVVEGNYAQSVESERVEKRRVPIVQISAKSRAHDDRLAGTKGTIGKRSSVDFHKLVGSADGAIQVVLGLHISPLGVAGIVNGSSDSSQHRRLEPSGPLDDGIDPPFLQRAAGIAPGARWCRALEHRMASCVRQNV